MAPTSISQDATDSRSHARLGAPKEVRMEMRRPVAMSLLLVGLAALTGCAKSPGADVVAKVGQSTITRAELDRALEQEQGQAVLDRLVTRKLIGQEAARQKVTASD